MSPSQPTIADEIERYLRTGAADMDGWAWSGDFMERCRRQHTDLRSALVDEVRRLTKGCTHEPVPEDVGVAFTRAKVEPMVRGLFSKFEQQLNFVQHVKSLLKVHGRAGVVLPDNVLFEGGAGETVRRKLLHECDLHTILRLPTGIFYAQGVKANVLFFDRKPGSDKPWTKKVWVYDHRTNCHYTLKTRRMTRADLDDFVACYRPGDIHNRKQTWSEKKNPEGRWRSFAFDEIAAPDKCSLDLFWLRDESLEDSASLPDPHILARRSPTTSALRSARSRTSWTTWKHEPRRGHGSQCHDRPEGSRPSRGATSSWIETGGGLHVFGEERPLHDRHRPPRS